MSCAYRCGFDTSLALAFGFCQHTRRGETLGTGNSEGGGGAGRGGMPGAARIHWANWQELAVFVDFFFFWCSQVHASCIPAINCGGGGGGGRVCYRPGIVGVGRERGHQAILG